LEEKMKRLIEIQACDRKIAELRRRIEEGPSRIQALEEVLKQAEAETQAGLTQVEEAKKERRTVERQVDERESQIQKSNVKLSNIKSNKEYQASLKEIDTLRHDKTALEDRAIELMEQIETLERQGSEARNRLESARESTAAEKSQILSETKAMVEEAERLEKARQALCVFIEADLLKRYDFLRERKGGLGISPVIKGICQTCHIGIPPQQFNLLLRGEELMSCPNCNRIIYWGENKAYSGETTDSGDEGSVTSEGKSA
jgi:predicted  nucleic acid-binding Zn-ribbon protein